MAAEVKTKKAGGVKIETFIAKRTHQKLKKYSKKNGLSMAQLLRNLVQIAVK
jgi:hypothetical protein